MEIVPARSYRRVVLGSPCPTASRPSLREAPASRLYGTALSAQRFGRSHQWYQRACPTDAPPRATPNLMSQATNTTTAAIPNACIASPSRPNSSASRRTNRMTPIVAIPFSSRRSQRTSGTRSWSWYRSPLIGPLHVPRPSDPECRSPACRTCDFDRQPDDGTRRRPLSS